MKSHNNISKQSISPHPLMQKIATKIASRVNGPSKTKKNAFAVSFDMKPLANLAWYFGSYE